MSRISQDSNKIYFRFGKYRAELFKRQDIKDGPWWVRVYLSDEKKYWSRTTERHILEEAKEHAHTLLVEMTTAKATGHAAVSLPLDRLITEYLAHLANERMSEHTRANLKRRLQLCVQFLLTQQSGLDFTAPVLKWVGPTNTLKLSAIKGDAFMYYLSWRLQNNPKLRRDTVAMELGTIKKMFKWAQSKRMCGESAIPVWDFKIEKESAKRKRLDGDEADRVLKLAKEWSEQLTTTEREAYGRQMLYYVLAVMAGTGMRTGEVLGLKNRNVIPNGVNDCQVDIDKTKANPRVIPVNGTPCMLLEWIAKHQLHKKPDDYVFSRHKSGTEFAEGVINKIHTKFKEEVLKPAKLNHVTPYHQRHQFISDCLRASANLIDVGEYCGTSPRMISKTYSHITGRDAGLRVLSKLRDYQRET